ncbi:MAG: hypothetical protein WCV82_01140 [Candidatus Paceibacterota bacterium]
MKNKLCAWSAVLQLLGSIVLVVVSWHNYRHPGNPYDSTAAWIVVGIGGAAYVIYPFIKQRELYHALTCLMLGCLMMSISLIGIFGHL